MGERETESIESKRSFLLRIGPRDDDEFMGGSVFGKVFSLVCSSGFIIQDETAHWPHLRAETKKMENLKKRSMIQTHAYLLSQERKREFFLDRFVGTLWG